MDQSKVEYFYGGPFSQWVPCSFVDENNIKYNCTEQYMMAFKAKLMKDEESYQKIMQCKDPETMKYEYGRNVKNFDSKLWDEHKFNIVTNGNLFKFTQNKEYHNYIKKFKNHIIAEASPTDTIWGIGLSVEDAKKGKEWRGDNLLGKAIMKVRDFIIRNPNLT